MPSNYTIRTMTRQELDIAVGWAAAEGWNPGLHDADCFYAADPNGFWIGLVDDEPVASISAVKYGDSFGFVGFYIVKPEWRGQGYGLQLWKTALRSLQGRTIGLDGVVAQQENYQKSGFVRAYANIRYQGVGGGEAPVDVGIVPLSEVSFEAVCAYDKPFFPGDRPQFLKHWLNQPDSTAFGVLQNGNLAGYGVIRRCRSGHKVGPLFADTPKFADSLFATLRAHIPFDAPVFLDIPVVNAAALELVNRYQMSVVFETARMYVGESPNLPLDRLFGVTTFELG